MNLKSHAVFQQPGLGGWLCSGCPAWGQLGPGGCAQPGVLEKVPWGDGSVLPAPNRAHPPFLQLPSPLHHTWQFRDQHFHFTSKALCAQGGWGLAHGGSAAELQGPDGRTTPPAPPHAWFILTKGAVCQHPVPSSKWGAGSWASPGEGCSERRLWEVTAESEGWFVGSVLNEWEKGLLEGERAGLQSNPQNTHYGEPSFPAPALPTLPRGLAHAAQGPRSHCICCPLMWINAVHLFHITTKEPPNCSA